MSPTPILLDAQNAPRLLARLPRATRLALRFLTGIRVGTAEVTLPDGNRFRIETGCPGPSAEIRVAAWRFARRALIKGDVGLGESYRDGDWDSPDVTAVLALFAANAELAQDFLARAPLTRLALRFRHLILNRNSRAGARRNISAHYDLGNAFYGHWLDPSMTYSSALFAPGDNDLEAAQTRKYRVLAEGMRVRPGDHVLEIGCGWGGFAEYLAREHGARVTAVTISRAQHAYAQARIHAAGLGERVEIRLQDYRDITGRFDAVGSIEMFEAVGERYWPGFFAVLAERLRPGGRAGLQIITIQDRFFEDYRRNVDFIRRHIFPGGMLPAPGRLGDLAGAAGFTLESERVFGRDYAETLRQWRQSFEAAWPRLVPLGFDTPFRRLWRYYLSYCEAGFEIGTIDVRQLVYRPA
jgi:cyclopropane-fatty-acyl-phospholipid synthase